MSKIDRVKPVRRYRRAKYPSHADPDPTTWPAPVEFPFHRELVRAVAGVGLAAAMFGTALSQDAKQNPFPLAKSGLPHVSSPFGTGQPGYLSDQTAVRLIHKVFKEEGFELQTVPYDKDGVAFRPSGFDPKRRIGYVWGNWNTLDADAIVSWMGKGQPEPEQAADIRKWFSMNEYKLKALSPDQQKEAARLQALQEDGALVEGFKKFLKSFHSEFLSLDEIKKLEEEGPKKKEFIAVISQFDSRFLIRERGYPPEVAELFKKAAEANDPELQKKAEEKMRQALEEQAKQQLQTLERNVREYIAWARTQGLQ
jgi:hypothetical protein